MEILSVKDLTFKYPNAEKNALNGISFAIERGEIAVLCGVSGCGKTTLLRLLKREIAPFGEKSGIITFDGKNIDTLDGVSAALNIGFVMQDPDSQIVTDTVAHELAFGLENIGIERREIRRRVGEMASYFGIRGIFLQSTDELSGGQKQLLNLASVTAMQPSLLLLDEPTSRLDPIAADEFIRTLQKLNDDFGLTVIIAEHRLDAIIPIANRVLLMQDGKLIINTSPRNISAELLSVSAQHPMLEAMPAAVRISGALSGSHQCALNVKECKKMLLQKYAGANIEYTHGKRTGSDKKAIQIKNVWFRYGKNEPDVLRGLSLDVYDGEWVFVLGGNGAGKSTLFSLIAGLQKTCDGKISINNVDIKKYKDGSLYRGCLSMLPQEPKTLFVTDKVIDDMLHALSAVGICDDEAKTKANGIAKELGIIHLLQKHPYDLSGGELQKCAIALILLKSPKILLLDEPTKGLDAAAKRVLGEMLLSLKARGITLLAVTHDLDFAAEYGDRCALLFDGEITSDDEPHIFFAHNAFYTTAASLISREITGGTVTASEVISALDGRETV